MNLPNLFSRVLVSIIAIPIIILIVWAGKIPFLVFTVILASIASYELNKIIKAKGANPSLFLFVSSSMFLIANVFFKYMEFILSLIVLFFIMFFYELFSKKSKPINNLGAYFFNLIYIGTMFSSFILIREKATIDYEENFYITLSLFVGVWICDSAAYFVGSKFGKHKLFPRVSPKKSWEGAIAGLILAIGVFYVFGSFFYSLLSLRQSLVLGLIVGVIGQIGDLCESLIKRDSNIKDSSSIIPGHGGVLDRFDSLLFVFPAAYFYLSFIN